MDWIVLVIVFIFGAISMFMLVCISYAAKQEEPVNKVHFFVIKDDEDTFFKNNPILWLGVPKKASTWCPTKTSKPLAFDKEGFRYYGLNFEDFTDMKEGEIREVFLNMED